MHDFDRKIALAPVLALTPRIFSNPASFEQLTAISRHPVISQHVTHLFYESDVLDRYESQDNWERNLVSERNRVKSPINSGEGDREYLVYQREFVKIDRPRHQLPREAMDRCYAQYQRLFTLQEQLRDQDYGTSIISEALSHLPKLTSISTSFTPCPHECYRYLVGQFRLCLQRPFGDLGHGQPRGTSQLRSLLLGYGQPRGTSQLRSLLLGYYNAGTQLTRLELGDINWQFLRNESEENMRMMKQSLRHLRELDLNLTTEYDVYDDEIGMEISECREYLTNNALYDFIKAAPMLEDLSVSFQHNYPMGCTTELKHIVSDHHWTNLRRANFENILASQADFANFCSHHASTETSQTQKYRATPPRQMDTNPGEHAKDTKLGHCRVWRTSLLR